MKEQNIFGTSRLGTYKTTQKTKGERKVGDAEDAGGVIFGNRTYEMTNHLGNVMVTVSDRVKKENGAFDAVVISAQDYYPYGLMMTGRVYSKKDYRYGFGGMEKDDEIAGENNHYKTLFRLYNPRIGRWLSLDQKAGIPSQVGKSPYAFSWNVPILLNDPMGDCPPGVDCSNPLPSMQVRRNRASNLGPGRVRNNATRNHRGHDLYSPAGTSVRSSMAGEVVSSYYSISYGNTVVVKSNIHPEAQPSFIGPKSQVFFNVNGTLIKPVDNVYVQYSHLTQRDVAIGDNIAVGEQVGTVGTTGNASAGLDGLDTHLHIQVGPSLNSYGTSVNNSTAINPNLVYSGVSFSSADVNANQGNTGVVKTVTNGQGQTTKIYQQQNSNNDAILLEELVISEN